MALAIVSLLITLTVAVILSRGSRWLGLAGLLVGVVIWFVLYGSLFR